MWELKDNGTPEATLSTTPHVRAKPGGRVSSRGAPPAGPRCNPKNNMQLNWIVPRLKLCDGASSDPADSVKADMWELKDNGTPEAKLSTTFHVRAKPGGRVSPRRATPAGPRCNPRVQMFD
eukprot:342658-Pyramimonas_sp.AAC.1